MKRYGDLYAKVYDLDNLRLAHQKARRGKGDRYGVRLFEKNLEANLLALQRELMTKTYRTSPYETFIIREPKEREIFRLPFRDRVIHHAIMNVLEPIWVNLFSFDTFSCIKKRGIHGAEKRLRRDLKRNPEGTRYCLKLDVKKFYPSVDHGVMKSIVRLKIKDPDLLWLIDEIIDSAPGVPIGNYLSQYLANLYLAYFDHDIKTLFGLKASPALLAAYIPEYIERSRATGAGGGLTDSELAERFRNSVQNFRIYKRYADDIVALSSDKVFLSMLLDWISLYLWNELRLRVKENWQIFPVESRGIDFVGYVTRHDYILLRKSIKKNFARKVARSLKERPLPGDPESASRWDATKEKLVHTVCSYFGWCLYCDSKNFFRKILNSLDDEIKLCIPKTVHF